MQQLFGTILFYSIVQDGKLFKIDVQIPSGPIVVNNEQTFSGGEEVHVSEGHLVNTTHNA